MVSQTELIKVECLAAPTPPPQGFWFRVCISEKLSDDMNGAGVGLTLRKPSLDHLCIILVFWVCYEIIPSAGIPNEFSLLKVIWY